MRGIYGGYCDDVGQIWHLCVRNMVSPEFYAGNSVMMHWQSSDRFSAKSRFVGTRAKVLFADGHAKSLPNDIGTLTMKDTFDVAEGARVFENADRAIGN